MDQTNEWHHNPYTTEEQLTHLRQQIQAAETDLFEREAELVGARAEMYAFQLEYDTLVGRTEAELERFRKQISEYRQWGPDGPPRTIDGTPYVSVEEQYRRAWQTPPPPSPPRPPKPVSAATEAQIKKLYRQLCRRFHPDLSQDAEERVCRTEMMTAINAAYSARSLVELETLAEKPDCSPLARTVTDEQRLPVLRDKLQKVERRLREVEQEFRALMNSPDTDLSLSVKFARREERDLLAEMAADVEKELEQKRVELNLTLSYAKELGLDRNRV